MQGHNRDQERVLSLTTEREREREREREIPKAAPSRAGWTNPDMPEVDATLFTDNAASHISTRSDYCLARHDVVRFNV